MENERLEFRFSMPDSGLGTNHRRRLHWGAINELTEKWKAVHKQELLAQCPTLPFFDYALVEIEQILPNFRSVTDNDNLTGKTKTLLDAMTECGMWEDDSPSHVEIAIRARQQKGAEAYLRVLVQPWTRPEPLEPLSGGGKSGKSRSSPRSGKKSSRPSNGAATPTGNPWVLKRR